MAALAATIGGVSIGLLHQTTFNQSRAELVAAVQSQARLIDAVARFDRRYNQNYPAGASAATISQIEDALGTYNGFGKTGEFVVGKRDGDKIVFILNHRNIQGAKPQPVPIDSDLSEPMRLALSGQSGTVQALDYQGVEVLAAFEPIAELDLGLVAKVNVSEIEAPFYRAGMIVATIAVFAIGLGSWMFFRTTMPILKRLEYQTHKLREEIAERKQTDTDLRKLSQALNQSPNMVFITDLDGTIEYVNPRFTEMTGYTDDEAVGQSPRMLKSGDTPPDYYASMWQNLKSGKEWRGVIKDKRKDGSFFWASMVAAPVVDEHGELSHYIAIHEDITEKKVAEEHTKRARKQAEIANRAKSELIANMSHELRTPLNAIIGFSNSISQQYFGPLGHEKYLEYICDIHDSGQHLLELINDILDVSAIESGKLQLHDDHIVIAELIHASARLIRPRAAKGGLNLNITRTKPDLMILGDSRRLKQVLLNLLSNAVKFTPEGGRVTITTDQNPNGTLCITVADTGIGMDEDELAKAMTQFGQVDSGLDRRHEGTGLGLPLTKSLIELHGGTFQLDSVPSKGTRATIILPKNRVLDSTVVTPLKTKAYGTVTKHRPVQTGFE